MNRYLLVGAGFTGAVLARELIAREECRVLVLDERDHIGGNCHTQRDPDTGIMVHRYGPHIFNTSRKDVWEYVQRFGEFGPYTNRVKASIERGVFSMPINLLTINQFFGKRLSPNEARAFVATLGDTSIAEPQNFEEQALKMIGPELYGAFFYGYTRKQWGCEPTDLPASILKRLPVRFNYDDNYYSSLYQGIPVDGYTALIQRMLDLPEVEVRLGTRFERGMNDDFDHVFYSGPIDAYFDCRLGKLGYRTVYWDRTEAEGDFQGNAVINYPDIDVPYTRIHEHKHFTPWETHERTLAFTEFSKETEPGDIPYYPKRLEPDRKLLDGYVELAREERGVSFLGRLATYRYLDMHQVIGEALDFVAAGPQQPDGRWPTFPVGAV